MSSELAPIRRVVSLPEPPKPLRIEFTALDGSMKAIDDATKLLRHYDGHADSRERSCWFGSKDFSYLVRTLDGHWVLSWMDPSTPGDPSDSETLHGDLEPARELTGLEVAAWIERHGYTLPDALQGVVLTGPASNPSPAQSVANDPLRGRAGSDNSIPCDPKSAVVLTASGIPADLVNRVIEEHLTRAPMASALIRGLAECRDGKAKLKEIVLRVYKIKKATKTQDATARQLIGRIVPILEIGDSPLRLAWDGRKSEARLIARDADFVSVT
ncbi:MAG: hypothetical protein ACLQGP_36790 [Isosphaeraceae bacterium]